MITTYLHPDRIKATLANLSQLVFEVTDACNLKCTYCGYGEFYEDYDKREGAILPTSKAIELINYLTEYWRSEMNTSASKTIYISFYGGEPLLNMSFIQSVVAYVKTLDIPSCKFKFSMTTNALLLNRYMDFLKEHGFVLLISLDGNKENTAYRIDKNGYSAFDRITKNVDILKEKYPNYFEKQVNFNAVLHNKNSVEEIYSFFKERYGKIPRIGELNNMGIRADKRQLFMQTYRNMQESLQQSEHYDEIERDMFMNASTYYSALLYIHQYSGFVYKNYTDLLFDKSNKKIKKNPTGTCLPFSKKMYVTVSGKILPCERIGHQFVLGEVTDTEVKLDFDAIAEKYNRYYAKMERQCEKCENIATCIQCIFNLDNIDEKPTCQGFMTEEMFNRYVENQLNFFRKNPEAYTKLMNEVIIE